MSKVRKLREKPVLPKALACGMLEDGGRVLFLIRKDRNGVERIEMPCVYAYPGDDPTSLLKEEFSRQTGIDAEIGDIMREGRHNAGSRKRRKFIPVLVFKVRAKNMRARPSSEFSGVKWLSLEKAKDMRVGRKAEWLIKRR